ncbi:MAG: protein phosphatase 2C family protein [Gammaproteobacteria bacterium]|nr:MAG: protein phosphatase 2C family protein [Gammaproteobacteria bacterium]
MKVKRQINRLITLRMALFTSFIELKFIPYLLKTGYCLTMKTLFSDDPINGLQEEILLEIADDREIAQSRLEKITLENLYNSIEDPSLPHSYAGCSAQLAIGFAELHGLRYAQEDRIAFGTLPEFEKLTHQQRLLILEQTIQHLNHVANDNGMETVGSTLCAAILCENHIYTANVGDSTAYLAVLDQKGQMSQFKRLNETLHHPTEPAELLRLQKAGKEQFIRYDRLMNLALSRAVGDTALETYGLIHTPDLSHHEVHLPPNGKAWVIIACDGLTETPGDSDTLDIATLIQENQEKNAQEIAKILTHHAFASGSTDNISALVTSIDPSLKMAKYVAVFDGHGGAECAELLRTLFHPFLKNTLQQEIKA